jgi:arylformamidase
VDHTIITQYDFSHPIDISMPLRAGLAQVNCFWAPPVRYEPVREGSFVGSTAEGGVVNFFNVAFNPHGNGTHTECVGHIAKERYVLHECLQHFHFPAQLLTVYPQLTDTGDRVIYRSALEAFFDNTRPTRALIIRTMPNDDLKLHTNYSGANPPYLHHEAMHWLVEKGIEHLLVDLPSVDRESDEGQLLAHKAFWRYPGNNVRTHCTITELIYVPDHVRDGFYLLNLQTAPFDLDASPSRPVLFPENRR